MSRENAIGKLKVAARKGDVQAQTTLAAKLAVGDGVGQDVVEAVRLYGAAAKQGSSDAAFNLATMYARGEGMRASWPKAAALYRKAEKLGSSDASIALGEFALRKNGKSEVDPSAALHHFALAALRRDGRGVFSIATTLQEHPMMNVSRIARVLFQACAEAGNKEAKKVMRRLG